MSSIVYDYRIEENREKEIESTIDVDLNTFGEEEGDECKRPVPSEYGGETSCNGIIELEELEGCSCHLGHPPCSACTNRKLYCKSCGWEEDE